MRFLILLFLILPLVSVAQNDTQLESVRKYNRLIDKVQFYNEINLDTSQIYLDSVFEITKELKQDYYLAKAFQLKSQQFMQASDGDSALYYCNRSIQILNQYPDSMAYFAAQYNLGTIYLSSRDHIRALVQFKSVLSAIDENFETLVQINQKAVNLNRAYAYASIGMVFAQLGDHNAELRNLKKALKISYKIDTDESRRLQAITLGNMGQAYYNLQNFDQAEYYAIAGMEQKKMMGMTGTLGYNYQVLAKAAFGRGKIKLCLKYLKISDRYFRTFNNHIEMSRNDFFRTKCYAEKGRVKEALMLIEKLEPTYQISFPDEEVAELYELKATLYKGIGDFELAYSSLELSKKIGDGAFVKHDRQMVSEFLDFFESEEKKLNQRLEVIRSRQVKEKLELQIEGDKERKVWVYTLFVVSIAGLLLIIWMITRAYKRNKRVNEFLSDSIHENEVLFKEVHHRVKNNFQIISSLLNLQQGMEEDEHSKKVLKEAQGRIRSMALVHELLYQKSEVKRIDFKSYATELMNNVLESYADGGMIEYEIKSAEHYFDLEVAVPLGLIMNEAVTNAIKYAFNDLKIGKIVIELQDRGEGRFSLLIKDNGVGMPEALIRGERETLGVELIDILSEQLGGSVSFTGGDGTTVKVDFLA